MANVDGTEIWGENQLRLVVYPILIPLFAGLYTSQVVVWDIFHQQYLHTFLFECGHVSTNVLLANIPYISGVSWFP